MAVLGAGQGSLAVDLVAARLQRGGGYDRNIFEPVAVHGQIEYMHNTPVRRGLCVNPTDWYWSSAAEHARLRTGPLPLDFDSLPMITGP